MVMTAPAVDRNQAGRNGSRRSALRDKPSINSSRKTAITSGVMMP